jgi:glycosyltransferase involved in cell wall biosynthesis
VTRGATAEAQARPLRILLVSQFLPGEHDTDFGVFVAQIADALERRGHVVERVAVRHRGGSRAKHLRLGRDALRGALRFDPDVVYAHFLLPAGGLAALASLAGRAPLVVTAHGQDVYNLDERPAVRAATALTIRRASAVIVVSGYLRDRLVARVPSAAVKVEVIDCGVDLARFAPRDAAQARRELDWKGDDPLYLFVGTLDERKNVVALADAFQRLEGGSLVLVGDGPLRPQLEGRERVWLLGRQSHDRVAAWMAACDVFCLPSHAEAFGQVVLEALACERSVMATRVGGPADVVTEAAGVLVDPESVDSIADGMRAAAALPRPNPAARAVAAEHDLELQAQRIEAVLRQAAERRPREGAAPSRASEG